MRAFPTVNQHSFRNESMSSALLVAHNLSRRRDSNEAREAKHYQLTEGVLVGGIIENYGVSTSMRNLLSESRVYPIVAKQVM